MPGGVRSMKGERQMIYKSITFKAAPFSYDLEFDDRITLVWGETAALEKQYCMKCWKI